MKPYQFRLSLQGTIWIWTICMKVTGNTSIDPVFLSISSNNSFNLNLLKQYSAIKYPISICFRRSTVAKYESCYKTFKWQIPIIIRWITLKNYQIVESWIQLIFHGIKKIGWLFPLPLTIFLTPNITFKRSIGMTYLD